MRGEKGSRTVAWFIGLPPPLSVSLSFALALSPMHTPAHWPENSRIPVWALSLTHFIAASFPSKHQRAAQEPHFAISVLNSLYQFSAFQSICFLGFVVRETEDFEIKLWNNQSQVKVLLIFKKRKKEGFYSSRELNRKHFGQTVVCLLLSFSLPVGYPGGMKKPQNVYACV